EADEVVDVVVTKPGDEVVLSTSTGMAIRFSEADARPMGRNTSGVKGISLTGGSEVVGMVVADPAATLLSVCEKGYGKRTNFGPNAEMIEGPPPSDDEAAADQPAAAEESPSTGSSSAEPSGEVEPEEGGDEGPSGQPYRTQRRGGKGLRDIKTTER